MPTFILVKGTSEPQSIQLTDDGDPLNGTGQDLDIEFAVGAAEETDAVTVAWLSQSGGTLQMTNTENLPVGSHKFRFTLTDGGGGKGYVPNLSASPNVLQVVKV